MIAPVPGVIGCLQDKAVAPAALAMVLTISGGASLQQREGPAYAAELAGEQTHQHTAGTSTHIITACASRCSPLSLACLLIQLHHLFHSGGL